MNKYILFYFLFLFLSKMYSQQTVCYGTTKTYSVDTTGSENKADGTGTLGSTYDWVVTGTGFNGAIQGNTTNSIKINWKTTPAGSYKITVIETNNGCPAPAQQLDITIKTNPVISTANVEVCAGLTNTISSSLTSGVGGGTYTWTVPTGATDPGNVSSFSFGTAGNYTVTYTDTDTCISNSAIATLTVNPLPSAVIAPFTDATTTFCAGGSVQLSAPAGLSYVWYKNGSDLGQDTTLSNYIASVAGNYTVKTKDTKGCVNTTTTATVVTVNPLPIITVAASGSLEFCNLSNVTLTANPSGATAPYSYQWKNSASSLATQTNSTYTASTTENYSVTVTDNNTCFATSSAKTVTVRPNPAPVITNITPLTFCAGDSVLLNVNTGTNYLYQWKNSSGDIVVGGNLDKYNALESADYSVKVVDNTYSTACTTTSLPVTVTKKALPVTSTIGY